MAPDSWAALRALTGQEKAFALVDDAALGPGVVADIVAPFVFECWGARNAIRSHERGADGSDAMA